MNRAASILALAIAACDERPPVEALVDAGREQFLPPSLSPGVIVEVGRIDARGGLLRSLDGRAEVAFPASAFSAPAEVELRRDGEAEIGPRYCLEMAGDLHGPAVARLSIDRDLLPLGDLGALRLGVTATTAGALEVVAESRADAEGQVLGLVGGPDCFGVVRHACGAIDARAECGSPERCVVDEDAHESTTCAIACSGDAECPAPMYCKRGACGLGLCDVEVECPRPGDRCVAGACVPERLGARCGPGVACDAAHPLCYAPTGVAGRCTDAASGCVPGTPGCSLRVDDAFEGFYTSLPSSSRWAYGARHGLSVEEFIRLPDPNVLPPSLFYWGNVFSESFGPLRIGVNTTTVSATFDFMNFPPRRLFMHPVIAIDSELMAVLQYRVPRRGKYLVRVDVMAALPKTPGATVPLIFMELKHRRRSIATNLLPPGELTLFGLGARASVTTTVTAEAGDFLELENSESGVSQRRNYAHLSLQYVYLGEE